MKKSWPVLFIATLLLILSFPVSGKVEDEYESGPYSYYLEDGKAIISEYTGDAAKLTIPSKLNGHPVIGIGYNAFSWADSLTSVIIPKGVTRIESSAFNYCESLTAVTIPTSVKTIESGAFSECESLASIKFPTGLEVIEDAICKDCPSLASVTIPASVISIGDEAFSGCYDLKDITLPAGLEIIGNQAFMDCDCLASIEIPKNVKTIGDEAFSGCYDLESVSLPEGLTSIGKEAFSGSSIRSIQLPESLDYIGEEAFSYCNLVAVTIPPSVTIIGDRAFANCSFLLHVYMPERITDLGEDIFSESSSVCIKGSANSSVQAYARANGTPFVYEGITAQELCQAYVDEGESPEVFWAKWSLCPGAAGLYEQVREILGRNGKLEEFEQLCRDLSAYEDLRKDSPMALDYMVTHDISSLPNTRQAFFMSLMKAGMDKDLMACIYQPSQKAEIGPVLWTDKALRDCFGKSSASFVPKQPQDYVCLLSMGEKSQIAIEYEDIYPSAQRSIDELADAQVDDIIGKIEAGSDEKLSFSGNPHLATFLINFSVSYPLRGTYTSEDDGHKIKGYNCKITLTAYTMAKHKKIAGMTLTSILDDEVYVSEGTTKVWEYMPVLEDSEELTAFINKLLSY